MSTRRFLMVFVLATVLAGCGGGNNPQSAQPSAGSTTDSSTASADGGSDPTNTSGESTGGSAPADTGSGSGSGSATDASTDTAGSGSDPTNTGGQSTGGSTPADTGTSPAPAGSEVVLGYLTSWGLYDRNYGADAAPADRLTHINYAFANVSAAGEVVLGDPWADTQVAFPGDATDQPLKGNFNQLLILKQQHPGLKTLISVGGWTWSGRFSDVALTASSRERFARSAVDFVVRYGFDGVDIDWEYPVGGGLASNTNRPEDRHNFTLLMAELRRQLDARGALDGKRYLLTAAIGAGKEKVANLEVAALSGYLDWFNLMTYDFHGAWDGVTGHHAALRESSQDPSVRLGYTVEDAVSALIGAGAPARKIVVGVPFYGRAWQQVPPANGGLFQSASSVAPPGTGETGSSGSGINDYREILDLIASGQYVRHWDDEAKAPYVYSAARFGGHFISYEDKESLRQKVAYVKNMGLRGMMTWELAADAVAPAESLLDTMFQGLVN